MQPDAQALLGLMTIVLLPLIAWLGTRQINRVDKDIASTREECSRELAEAKRVRDGQMNSMRESLERGAREIEKRTEEAHMLAVRALDSLNTHRIHVAESFVSAKRYEAFEGKIMDSLERIEAKLDRKVDKAGHD